MDERETFSYIKQLYRLFRASFLWSVSRAFFLYFHVNNTKNLYVKNTLRKGFGLFTNKRIKKGELAFIVAGPARHFTSKTSEECYRYQNWFAVDKDTWIDPVSPYVFSNHSCAPNLGIRDKREFVALYEIEPNEELTFDYSITEDELLWQLVCACGEKECRKVIRSIQFLPKDVYTQRLPYIPKYFQKVYTEGMIHQKHPEIEIKLDTL